MRFGVLIVNREKVSNFLKIKIFQKIWCCTGWTTMEWHRLVCIRCCTGWTVKSTNRLNHIKVSDRLDHIVVAPVGPQLSEQSRRTQLFATGVFLKNN